MILSDSDLPWWQLRLSSSQPEEAAALLVDSGAGGAQIIDDHHLLVYFQGSQARLDGFIEQLPAVGASLVDYSAVPKQNWTAQCPDLWKPLHIGKLRITPYDDSTPFSARTLPPPDEIRIIPGTGFGTGHHASTGMLLELMQSEQLMTLCPKRVLDVGTGSGILAITAQRLYAAAVLATDIDPLALENARQNSALNGTSREIELSAAETGLIEGSFALIVANIYAEVLCSLRPDFERVMMPSGMLLMSGIMLPRAAALLRDFESNGWSIQNRMDREGWVALAMTRGNEKPSGKSGGE